MRLMGLAACLVLASFVVQAEDESGAHYERARELYDQGPSKAPEILAELDKELAEHPESLRALSLKANVEIGIGEFETAMKTLDRYMEIGRKGGNIAPHGYYLRARCLYHMGEYEKARVTLEPFWAFFQDSDESKARYDRLMNAIMAKLPPPASK